jgi:hypothetical protein
VKEENVVATALVFLIPSYCKRSKGAIITDVDGRELQILLEVLSCKCRHVQSQLLMLFVSKQEKIHTYKSFNVVTTNPLHRLVRTCRDITHGDKPK